MCTRRGTPANARRPVLTYLGDVLERLVVRVDAELGGPKVTASSFDGTTDATGFKVQGCPETFVGWSG